MAFASQTVPTFWNIPDTARRRAKRFERGALARALAKDSNGNYVLAPADLPPLFFNDTRESAEAIMDFLDAVGHPELLEEYGAALLRDHAESERGRIDLGAVRDWEDRYASALSVLPGLVVKVQAIKDAAARSDGAHAINGHRYPRACPFVDQTPIVAVRKIFNAPDSARAVREVLDGLAADQRAIDCLRECAVDYLRDEVGISAARAQDCICFFEAHQTALKYLFAEKQLAICFNIYRQLRQLATRQLGSLAERRAS